MVIHLGCFCACISKCFGNVSEWSRIIVVEFVFAEIASTSQTIRTSFLTMLALVRSSGRFLSEKTHILFVVEFRLTSRSGLLTFFSSPMIQECLINFAGERLRSRMPSHCEIILCFCLSASHPV